jgi:glycerophosphoryl diester phosphodiesterase
VAARLSGAAAGPHGAVDDLLLSRVAPPAQLAALTAAASTVIAWTVDTEARTRAMLACGVDGITSNRLMLLHRPLGPGSAPV